MEGSRERHGLLHYTHIGLYIVETPTVPALRNILFSQRDPQMGLVIVIIFSMPRHGIYDILFRYSNS